MFSICFLSKRLVLKKQSVLNQSNMLTTFSKSVGYRAVVEEKFTLQRMCFVIDSPRFKIDSPIQLKFIFWETEQFIEILCKWVLFLGLRSCSYLYSFLVESKSVMLSPVRSSIMSKNLSLCPLCTVNLFLIYWSTVFI